MNRNRQVILLAAALVFSGCGAAGEKAGGESTGAAAASNVGAPSPAPSADGGADGTPANASAVAPTSSTKGGAGQQGASRAGGPRGAADTPPAKMPTPQIGSGGNDFFLFTQARAAVNADPELKAANLVLDVKEGVVTLSGAVASAAQKSRAEQLVREAGSQTVKNQLRVSAGN